MKRFLSFILCAMMLATLSLSAFASEPQGSDTIPVNTPLSGNEPGAEPMSPCADAPDGSHDDLIMPHGPCSQCGSNGFDYFCQEKVAKKETGTHTYGLGKKCTVTYYYCYSDWMCWNCKYTAQRNVGPHLCAEVHSDCSKGVYHVCTVGGWLPI